MALLLAQGTRWKLTLVWVTITLIKIWIAERLEEEEAA